MRPIVPGLGLLLLIGLASDSSAALPPLVESAFARVGGSEVRWAYTRSTVEDGIVTVERFDPATWNGGWILISIQGRTPSRKQVKRYAAKSGTRETRDHPGAIDFLDIVQADSITQIAESSASATFHFKAAPDDSAEADSTSNYLEGRLVIDKTGPLVESLELANASPFSPATGVKITTMRVRMEFALDHQGHTALRKLSQSVEGRLFGIKRINQVSTVTYSAFARPN